MDYQCACRSEFYPRTSNGWLCDS